MFSMKKIAGGLVGALTISSFAVPAQADTLRFALGFPAGAPIAAAGKYAEAVKEYTNNRHKVRIFELSLLNHSEMNEGISKGLADIGYLLTAYTPSDYPFSNMGADMSMLVALNDKIPGQESFAYAGAMLEFVMLNCPECLAEFKKNNQVYTGVVATPGYATFCNTPINTEEALKGKRIRISGAPWARWVREFGAQPVALPAGEAYEALSQGVIDCTFFSPTELTNFNLIEVVKNIVTDIPGGLYAAGGVSTINKTKWDSFELADKEALFKAGSVMTAEVTFGYQRQGIEDIEKSRQRGINVMKADPELLKKSKAFIAKDITYIPEYYAHEYKLDGVRLKQLSEKMTTLVNKWTDIIAKTDIKSADDLQKLYWDEVYTKVNVAKYSN